MRYKFGRYEYAADFGCKNGDLRHPEFGQSYIYTNEDFASASIVFESGAVSVIHINGIAYVIEVTDPVETYPVWFNGEQITSANCDDVLKDGGSVKYDPAAKTMTLNNPVNYYPASTKALIIADGTDLTVTGNAVLNKWHINNGINMINGADLIFDNANIVFDRPEYPVYANPGSDVTIQNSNIEALANYYFGMRADHITVKNSTVKAGGSNYGLMAYYGLVVEDGYVDSSATIVREGDITLYAKWLADAIVTFDVQGHGTAPEAQQIKYGETAAEPAAPSAEGYTFNGWYTDAACTTGYDFSTPVTADITLYARWLVNVKGFRIHADGTKLDGTYYILNTDVLEPVFEKDTEEAAVELGHLCTDSSCSNVITAPPEKGTTYFFMVYLKDVSSFEKGIQKIRFLPAIVENIDASAEDAVIEFDGLVSSAAEDAVTLLFKYTENEILYTISKGANASWTKGTTAGVDYTVNRNINDDKTYGLFESIEVDGKILDPSQYTAASGSLSASLKAAYLETLSEGDHTVTFHFKDGSVGTKLTIKPKPSVKATGSAGLAKTSVKSGSSGSAKTSVKSGSSGSAKSTGKTSPRTGDPSNPMLWIVLLILSIAGVVGLAVWRRRHKA